MKLPNILLVVPRFNIGGAESYVASLAISLKRRGYRVVVASWGGRLTGLMKENGIPHYYVPIRLHPEIAAFLLQKVIKKEQIELVHANSAAAASAVALACSRLQIPWVMTAHGAFGCEPVHKGIEQAERVICVSDYLRRELAKNTFIDHAKLLTMYNGIDTGEFQPDKAVREQLRTSWGLQDKDFMIGIVSRITSVNGKGHEDLIRMLANFEQAREWRLLIVGKGKFTVMWKLKQLVRRMGLSQRVIFAGHRTDISFVLNAVDVLALPSNYETFGLVLAEAMALEKPVLAYEVGGTPEVIEHGKTGYLVPKGAHEEFVHYLHSLFLDRNGAAKMGKNGRSRVLQLFDNEQMMERVTALYGEVWSEYEKGGGRM